MAIRIPSHLHRARSGILHFRIAIPPDLRAHFTVREIYRSLHTASVLDAIPSAQTLAQAAKRAFQQLRSLTMSNKKKTPTESSDYVQINLITELSFDDFMRPKLRLISEPGDTPEDRIQAQVEFLRATELAVGGGYGGAGMPPPTKRSPLLSELVEDYKRD